MAGPILRFQGHVGFRQRLLLATLAGKIVRIDNIRSDLDSPGLKDYEVSFLRLLEAITNGSQIEISYTGTTVVYKPGVLTGGNVSHECVTRAIGYYLEPMIALGPFCKKPLRLTLKGITNDNVDLSVDAIRVGVLPLLKQFGVEEDIILKIEARGAVPNGGGQVFFQCPVVRELKPVQLTKVGRIRKIRGIAWSTRVSPAMANRLMDSSRSFLTRYIPDVYVFTDVFKGQESGRSPGYGVTLLATSTTNAMSLAELSFQPRSATSETTEADNLSDSEGEQSLESTLQSAIPATTPEELGKAAAKLLLKDIALPSFVPSSVQWLAILLMTLTPCDVSRITLGRLEEVTVSMLRDIETVWGLRFKIVPCRNDVVLEEDGEIDEGELKKGVVKGVTLTCVGIGYINVSKKAV